MAKREAPQLKQIRLLSGLSCWQAEHLMAGLRHRWRLDERWAFCEGTGPGR